MDGNSCHRALASSRAVLSASSQKAFFSGTHRVRRPEDTWAAISPHLARHGITRIADVTGLDHLSVPTAQAIRPLGRTLSVTQGKGQSLLLAKISAAMEAIELWHAENVSPDPAFISTTASRVPLIYPLRDISQDGWIEIAQHALMDWVSAYGVLSGRETVVPHGMVNLSWEISRPWNSSGVPTWSPGLAAGNSHAEAQLHGLYEAIEKAVVSHHAKAPHAALRVDPFSITDPWCRDFLQRTRSILDVEIRILPNTWGMPCYEVVLTSEDLPGVAACGSGVHGDPGVALSRALTEAAQTRLTIISGTRDDIDAGVYARPMHRTKPRPDSPVDWLKTFQIRQETGDVQADVRVISKAIAAKTSNEPVCVTLAHNSEFSVVKIVCPGLLNAAYTGRRRSDSISEET
ncbi:YcaO-like family protein [Nonomuraea fuscirosea]|uniref:YcaO-like family protein n=1 Tax=Nonomuraea fuscirosea TaxID=1291556 RepID=UPI0034412A25